MICTLHIPRIHMIMKYATRKLPIMTHLIIVKSMWTGIVVSGIATRQAGTCATRSGVSGMTFVDGNTMEIAAMFTRVKKIALIFIAATSISACAWTISPRVPLLSGTVYIEPHTGYKYVYRTKCRWVYVAPGHKVRTYKRYRTEEGL